MSLLRELEQLLSGECQAPEYPRTLGLIIKYLRKIEMQTQEVFDTVTSLPATLSSIQAQFAKAKDEIITATNTQMTQIAALQAAVASVNNGEVPQAVADAIAAINSSVADLTNTATTLDMLNVDTPPVA